MMEKFETRTHRWENPKNYFFFLIVFMRLRKWGLGGNIRIGEANLITYRLILAFGMVTFFFLAFYLASFSFFIMIFLALLLLHSC